MPFGEATQQHRVWKQCTICKTRLKHKRCAVMIASGQAELNQTFLGAQKYPLLLTAGKTYLSYAGSFLTQIQFYPATFCQSQSTENQLHPQRVNLVQHLPSFSRSAAIWKVQCSSHFSLKKKKKKKSTV